MISFVERMMQFNFEMGCWVHEEGVANCVVCSVKWGCGRDLLEAHRVLKAKFVPVFFLRLP